MGFLFSSFDESSDIKQRFGGHIEVSYWNKPFMELMVNANLLREGKPSIGSTQQLSLYADLLTKGTMAKKSDFDTFSELTKRLLSVPKAEIDKRHKKWEHEQR
jgi:hypothetical protein